ncbi:MAG: nucleoside 2-deoxyribosyltransferase, partial [Pisciglobus halotolerans]|nr:nucleoside 2-deoxyribosyltransferase [Pisciglobus halotolerans]
AKLYYASPLFSEMEFAYNDFLVKKIRDEYPDLVVYSPQEQGDINDKNSYANSIEIAKYDTEALLSSDLMIAVLDGTAVDAGVASEVGVAYQAGIPILGLFTDSRQQGSDNKQKLEALKDTAESQFAYVNLYTVGLIKLNGQVYNTSVELIQAIQSYL